MKKAIKKILLMVNAIVYRDDSPKIVYYHDVGTAYTPMGTPEEVFWKHMDYLISLRPDVRHVVCFDDGFRGVWDCRGRFRSVDICPIIFIAIDLVGQPGYLTWDEMRTLQNEYGFNFQCHTWSHQTLVGPGNIDLPTPTTSEFRTDQWYNHELVDSKAELERQLGKSVEALCFPVGYFSSDVVARCVAAGYTRLYGSFPGNEEDTEGGKILVSLLADSSVNASQLQLIKLSARCFAQDVSMLTFKAILHGGLNPLKKRYLAQHVF